MKDFDPYTKQCIHIHVLFQSSSPSLFLSSSPVLLRRITQACRCQTILTSLLYNTPTPGRVGMSAYMHVGSKKCLHARPWWLPALVAPSTHPPRTTTNAPKRFQPSIAQQRQRQQTAPPECPDAVMVEWVKNVSATYLCYHTLSARVHLFQYATQQRRRSRCQH
jgi:hypothetical protein